MLDRTGSSQPADDALVRRVAVFRDPAQVSEIWEGLETAAAVSPYQTRGWILPWLETTGRSLGVSPFIVVAFDEHHKPLALLPLGLRRQGLLNVAGFLGGRDSNFNVGLFRPGLVWSVPAVLRLLRGAVTAGPASVDLFVLRNQPHQWEGVANPLTLLSHQPSPSFGYKVALFRDPEEFTRQNLSRDKRKKLRSKLTRLQALGKVEHRVAETAETGRAILDAFVEQRLSRCTALGIGASDLPDLEAFLARSSIVGSLGPTVELHGLFCGPRIVATFGGTSHRDRFCGMVMSFDADPEISRCSPGDILLDSLIRSKCVQGFGVFDLGIGEARYKQAYCPEPEPLFDSVVAVSRRGRLISTGEKMRLRLKREIKQSHHAWAAVRLFRRLLRALKG